ncbi:MAG: glycosyltransferase family 9 protein [Bdellovibrionales bacterium]|nr:glycosyltransferase family 9 protein [Bdellovibrionales bacterium]
MKRLIFRLSSLGDLILSQSVLEPPFVGETHWVVAKEFEALVVGNPKVAKVWAFDRRNNGGLGAWFRFLRELRRQEFAEVLDLHSTLRTVLARIYFRFTGARTMWRTISKERVRRIGYEILKRGWPPSWRPTHFSRKCARLAGGYGNERPNLRWLSVNGKTGKSGSVRIAVVPASAWSGKEWPSAKYREWIRARRVTRPQEELLLLGTNEDRAAVALRKALLQDGVPFVDGIGKFGLRELAGVLAECAVVVGSDTGLLHLAEAVGTPVVTIFGPTRSDFGFGPMDERSAAVDASLWCSPCSKDGSLCFRPIRRYECLQRIEAKRVDSAVSARLQKSAAERPQPPGAP